jgi:hypothetical protein
MFCSSQFLSTLFAVRSARPRKKNSAAKNYDVERKKIAYLARAVMSAFGTFETCRRTLRMSVDPGRPEVTSRRSKRRF